MNSRIKIDIRVEEGNLVKCIDDDLQHGLIKDKIYTIKQSESKNKKSEKRKIKLKEIKGKWSRGRFLLV